MIDQNTKTTIRLLLWLLAALFPIQRVWAWTSWYVPSITQQDLIVDNPTNEEVTLYLTGPGPVPGVDHEILHHIGPKKLQRISVSDLPRNWSFFHLKSLENRLSVKLSSSRQEIGPESGNQWSFFNLKYEKLALVNLSIVTYVVDSNLEALKEVLYPFESKVLEVGRGPVQIRAAHRAVLWGWSRGRWEALNPSSAPISLDTPKGVYFRASNLDGDQSFVFKIEDESLIKKARDQIQYPEAGMPRLIIAEIAPGHGEQNRDIKTDRRALTWSWHVEKFHGFSFFGSQECDASPQILEQILGSWLKKSKGICFWSYRVVEELTPEQVAQGR